MIELNIPATTTAATATKAAATATVRALQSHNNYGNNNQSTLSSLTTTTLTSSAAATVTALYSLCNQSTTWETSFENCSDDNNNNSHISNDTTNYDVSFILPWWRQVLWSILFGGMVIVATGGNLIVIWIVLAHKRMRTVTNYFIVNLSIADAMVSSLNVTFNYIYMLDVDWPFGEIYCKISQFIATLSISASVFTLMAISIDRYVAIIKPLQPRMGKRNTLTVAAFIWISSTVLSSPMLLFFTTDQISSMDGIRTVCYSEWPDGLTNHSHQEYIYNILFMILTYFLPIISMTVTYSRVGIELWGSKAIGEYTPRQVENVKSKRRVVKMMMVVVLIFAVCWLPFQIYFIVTSCYPAVNDMPNIQEVYLAIYWLAMSNSMYNPIIYCWMNSRFRRGFKQFFRWCPFVNVGAETLNRRDNMTSRYSCSGSPDHHRIKRNDTERSFLYTCPGSPKSHRVSHCGVLRNSNNITQRNLSRHSTPVGALGSIGTHPNNKSNYSTGSYQQGNNGNNSCNNHELTAMVNLNSSKDFMKVATRNNTLQCRQKWPTAMSPIPAASASTAEIEQETMSTAICQQESATTPATVAAAMPAQAVSVDAAELIQQNEQSAAAAALS